MTTQSYRITIDCGADRLVIGPTEPLKLLAGGLVGFDSTGFDVASSPYADDHGGTLIRRRFAERELSLRFELTENASLWRRRILSLISPQTDCVLHTEFDGQKRCIAAIPCGRVTVEQAGLFDLPAMTLRFLAPDPFWMAEESRVITFSEQVKLLTFPMNFYPKQSMTPGYVIRASHTNAVNEGNAPCGVTVVIQANGGTVVNPVIRCGSQFVRVLASLNAGEEAVIETRKRRKSLMINGKASYAFDRRSSFFSLSVGQNALSMEAAEGAEYMTVRLEYVPLYFAA